MSLEGFRIKGTIEGYDKYSIVVNSNRKQSTIYINS
ncbi:RNA chaperone Hfq [Peribacillus huizhouensis]